MEFNILAIVVAAVAALIDKSEGGDSYTLSVNTQSNLIDDAEATPSARVLEELRQSQAGFFQFAMNSAHGHKEYFSSLVSLEKERLEIYENEASQSIERQSEIEARDEVSFEDYLANYYSQDGCP